MPDGEHTVLPEGPPDPTSPQPKPQSEAEGEIVPEPEPEPDPAAVAAEAERLKEQGNDSFKRGRYGEAVDLYTKAIGMSSLSLSSFYYYFPLFFKAC